MSSRPVFWISACPSEQQSLGALRSQQYGRNNKQATASLLSTSPHFSGGKRSLVVRMGRPVLPVPNGIFGRTKRYRWPKPRVVARYVKFKQLQYTFLSLPLDQTTWLEEHKRKDSHVPHIHICDNSYRPLRRALMEISQRSAQWIRNDFLSTSTVTCSQMEWFSQILESWMVDPCDESGHDATYR